MTRRQLHICLFFLLSLCSCIEIVNVKQPTTAQIDQDITITLDGKITNTFGSTMIFGFLAPRSWQAALHTSVSYTSTAGNSTFSLIDPAEVEPENDLPWKQQITDRVGLGANYGEVEWVVFKADQQHDIPSGTNQDNPFFVTLELTTRTGKSNMITNLGYFIGEADWGYLNADDNSSFFFAEECLEISGASGLSQNLCGDAPRRLVNLETYNFGDVLTIRFDANEDDTALIGADQVFMCAVANHNQGSTSRCDRNAQTQMHRVSDNVWELTIWPYSHFDLNAQSSINEILINFQNSDGTTIVRDPLDNDFQIIEKCF